MTALLDIYPLWDRLFDPLLTQGSWRCGEQLRVSKGGGFAHLTRSPLFSKHIITLSGTSVCFPIWIFPYELKLALHYFYVIMILGVVSLPGVFSCCLFMFMIFVLVYFFTVSQPSDTFAVQLDLLQELENKTYWLAH